MVRNEIKKIIGNASVLIEKPGEKTHGDYSTNIAMIISGKKNPREVAEKLVDKIKDNKMFEKVEIAGPGFINFFISKEYLQKQIKGILEKKEKYGSSKTGKGLKINVEFISANPTGPLTLGNGRGGFGGDVLSNILEKAGYNVAREFYINDRGKQIEDLKKGLYKGEKRTVSQIQKTNQKIITKDMKIKFDVWFSEKSLYKNKEVDRVLALLKKKKLTYGKDDALWFKSTKFGDDKDRVLIKGTGEEAYLLSDVAYLKNKFDRGFKKNIIFIGADHHGYIKRMKAVTEALGYKKEQLEFIVMQLVHLLEGKKEVRMSKRAGTYVTVNELINEVGLDATRFFFLQRGSNSHLNFDLKLAKEKSSNNPVYYVQYAYARICAVSHKSENFQFPISNFQLLDKEEELALIKQLVRFEEVVEDTVKDYQIQRIPQYAIDLAESFHRFYQSCQVIGEDKKLSSSRLALVKATQIVLKNTLELMGISSPSKM
ncbi:arginine--tRNA ligase [Patescibacteria group bacterium]|nr:arginine--tRNA ligase [Patescibacteria group bacterium]